MTLTQQERLDDTIARLAPPPAEEPEIGAVLRAAYLEEKLLSQGLLALASRKKPGWTPVLSMGVKAVAEADEGHVRAVAEVLEELGSAPPERPETTHAETGRPPGVNAALSRFLAAKKDLEVRYVRAASLAAVEGRWRLTDRLEALAAEEAAGRRSLLTILSRLPAFPPED